MSPCALLELFRSIILPFDAVKSMATVKFI